MLSTLKRWGLGVVLAACGFALGHVAEGFYLKAKYPAVYKFENNAGAQMTYDTQTGKFFRERDADYDSDLQRGYAEEKSAMTLGIILASALLAIAAIRAGEKS